MSRPNSPIAPAELVSDHEEQLSFRNVPTPPPFFSPAMEGYADYQRMYAHHMEEYLRQGWMEESVLEDLTNHPCHLSHCVYCRLGHPDCNVIRCPRCEQAPVMEQEYYPCSSVCLVCRNCHHKAWHSCSTLLLIGYNHITNQ